MNDDCPRCKKFIKALQPFAHMVLLMPYDTDRKGLDLRIPVKWIREAQKVLGLGD